MIRVLVVDDHCTVRAGLVRLLDGEPDMRVVAQCGSGREAIALCRERQPSVVVLDYSLPDLDGLETTRAIVELGLGARVLILTMYANEEYATRVIRAGASGFVVKVASTEELLQGIRVVANRGVYVSPSILDRMGSRLGHLEDVTPETVLSDRELQVLVRLARGASSRDVSRSLCLSLSTIETYRRRILDKLGLRNNAEMTRLALRRGLIEVE